MRVKSEAFVSIEITKSIKQLLCDICETGKYNISIPNAEYSIVCKQVIKSTTFLQDDNLPEFNLTCSD